MKVGTSSSTRMCNTLRKILPVLYEYSLTKTQYILKLHYNRTSDAFGIQNVLCITIKLRKHKYCKTSRPHAYLINMGMKIVFLVLKYFLKMIHEKQKLQTSRKML